MAHSVRSHLRLDIVEYDAQIRRFIPGYEDMLRVAADAVAAVAPKLAVDLGAGTGALSAALLQRDSVGAVEVLDVDPEMMEQARLRLAGFGERVRLTLRSYDAPFSSCGAFAASLSLHHISEMKAKGDLYGRAFEALESGGVLVNADVFLPAEGREREALFRQWADHLVASGISEDSAWGHFDAWSTEDTYQPLDVELEALSTVGFEAERVWSRGPMGVIVARRPD